MSMVDFISFYRNICKEIKDYYIKFNFGFIVFRKCYKDKKEY